MDLFIGRSCTVGLVLVFSLWSLSERVRAQDGLLGHWCFNEGGGSSAADAAGDNDGVLANMDQSAWVRGQTGAGDGALHFDGVDDIVTAGSALRMDGDGESTFAAWIRTDGGGHILGKTVGGVYQEGAKTLFVDDVLVFDIWGIGQVPGSTIVADGEWHHVAVTKFGDEYTLYVDGQRDGSGQLETTDDDAADITEITFGFAEEVGEPFPGAFEGVIDDVRFVNVELSDDEINEIIADPGSGCPEHECNDPADTHCRGITVEGPGGTNQAGTWTVTVTGEDDGGDEIIYTVTAERADPPRTITQTQFADGEFKMRLAAGTWTFSATADDDALCDDAAADATCTSEPVEVVRPAEALVAHWCLNEGSGLAIDDRLGDNDGQLRNMDDDAWSIGVRGQGDAALYFDGENDIALGGTEPRLDEDAYTFAAWIRTHGVDRGVNLPRQGHILGKTAPGEWQDGSINPAGAWVPGSKSLHLDGDSVTFTVFDAGEISGTTQVDDNEWHHVAIVKFEDEYSLFIDGALEISQALETPEDGDDTVVTFGFANTPPCPDCGQFPGGYRGLIDDIRYWNFALGGDELQEVMAENPLETGCPETQAECDPADTRCDGIVAVGPDDTDFAGTWTVTINAADDGGDTELIYDLTVEQEDPLVEPGLFITKRQVGNNVFEVTLPPGVFVLKATVDDRALCDDTLDDATCSEEIVEAVDPEGESLIGHWCMDEGRGSVLRDSAGNSDARFVRAGDVIGGLVGQEGGEMGEEAWVAGHRDTDAAVQFDGVDDYVIVEDSSPFDIHFSNHTWSVWMKASRESFPFGRRGSHTLISQGPVEVDCDHPDHRGARYFLLDGNGNLQIEICFLGDWQSGGLAAVDLLDDEWHHVAYTAEMNTAGEQDTVRFYVDGVLDGEFSADLGSQVPRVHGTLLFGIAVSFDGFLWRYEGAMDDIRIYDFTLSEDEILELSQGGVLFGDPAEDCAEPQLEEPTFVRGDANADGATNIADPVFVLNHLFSGSTPPSCMKSADNNDDGAVNIADPVFLLNGLFGGGGPPAPPIDACGSDPTPDEVTCEAFAPCEG